MGRLTQQAERLRSRRLKSLFKSKGRNSCKIIWEKRTRKITIKSLKKSTMERLTEKKSGRTPGLDDSSE